MKISKQNLQKEGYMAPKAEAFEMMQEACILKGSIETQFEEIPGSEWD